MDREFVGEDSWDFDEDFKVHRSSRRRQPSPHHMRSDFDSGMLNPGFGAGLQRSRSVGQPRAPVVNVYNRMYQDNNDTNNPPYPPARSPPRRASPAYRSHRLGDEIVEDLAEMALHDRYSRSRSRSRGRSDAPAYDPRGAQQQAAFAEWELAQRTAQMNAQLRDDARKAEWELAQKSAQLAEDARKHEWEREAERIKGQYKLQAMEEELKRERDADAAKDYMRHARHDYERKLREEREKAESEERRIRDKIDRDARDAKDRREREMRDMLLKQQEEKERKEREMKELALQQKEAKERHDREVQEILMAEKEKKEKKEREEKEAEERFLRRQKEKKEKEEREEKEAEERFLRKQREKKEKEEKEKKEAEEKFQAEMRKRLAAMGYTEKTIEVLIDEEKAKKFREDVKVKETTTTTTTTSDTLDIWRGPHRSPVYPKIHRDYLEIETLKYYGLPWEYDRANPDYIIILRDMDKRETDILFEHSTRLRTGNLLLEPKKKEKEFAFYRKRSRSRGAPARVGIVELKR